MAEGRTRTLICVMFDASETKLVVVSATPAACALPELFSEPTPATALKLSRRLSPGTMPGRYHSSTCFSGFIGIFTGSTRRPGSAVESDQVSTPTWARLALAPGAVR